MKKRKRRSTVLPGGDRERSRRGLVHWFGTTSHPRGRQARRHGRHLLGTLPAPGNGADIGALSWLRRGSPSQGEIARLPEGAALWRCDD